MSFRAVNVEVKQAGIDRASAELAKVSEVIFNAVMSEPIGGDRQYTLGSIA